MKKTSRDQSRDNPSSVLQKFTSFLYSGDKQSKSNLEHEVLKLSIRDSQSLIDAIENPPEPSEGLLSVFE